MACDDAVLAETASPRAYAECLAHLAERSFVQRSLALAQAALGRVRQISFRVAQILDANRPTKRARNWKPTASAHCRIRDRMRRVRVQYAPTSWLPERGARSGLGIDACDSSPHIISPTVISERVSEVPSHRIDQYNSGHVACSANCTSEVESTNMAIAHLPVQGHRVALRHDPKSQTSGMVHLASGERTTPAPITETVFVLIESRPSGSSEQQVYQIQMWRLTVLRQTVDPTGTQPPRKQT